MSRPKPIILEKYTDPKTHTTEEVLEAEAIYSVFYKNKPINLRSFSSKAMLLGTPGPKYKKVSFSNPGHAFNLADRLNKMYKCDDFIVVKLTDGVEITETDI